MIPTRRSFLGTVLGVVGTTPFVAEAVPAKEAPSKILSFRRRIDIFFEHPMKLRDYTIYARIAETEELIFMPRILEVRLEPELVKAVVRSERLDVQTRMSFDAVGLLNAEGEPVVEYPLALHRVRPGDTLTVEVTIELKAHTRGG